MTTDQQLQDAIRTIHRHVACNDAVDTALANAKIEADAIAKDVRAKLAWLIQAYKGYELLFHDLQSLVSKPTDDFQLAVTSRIEGQKKAEAAKEAGIRAEERAKMIADAAKMPPLSTERVGEVMREIGDHIREEQATAKAVAFSGGSNEEIEQAVSVVARPGRLQIIECVASMFGVADFVALDWILQEFRGDIQHEIKKAE